MTKRRSIIALFLAVAILALGVGYAALTDNLLVTGSVQAPNFDDKITLVSGGATTYTQTGGADVVVATPAFTEGNDTATITVTAGFDHDGDAFTVPFKVSSTYQGKVKIKSITITDGTGNPISSENFSVTTSGLTAGTVLDASNGTTPVLSDVLNVTVTLVKVPTTAEATLTYKVTIKVDTVTAP